MKRQTWQVEILHTDSHCYYYHSNVVSVHEEGSYTCLVKLDGISYKFPTRNIWRIKSIQEQEDK